MDDLAKSDGQDLQDEEGFGLWDGRCQACDSFAPVNDLSLC